MTETDKMQNAVSFAAEIFPSLGSQTFISDPEMKMLEAVNASNGLVTISEALTLYRLCIQLPAGARILEIGSYLGASTTAIGHAILGKDTELYCLDCWHDYEAHGCFDQPRTGAAHAGNEVFLKFLKTTEFLNEQLRILKGTTEQFRTLLPTSFFDFIFIDAGHEYKDVINDLISSLKTLAPGGLLLGHDYHSDGHGVVTAVNQVIYESQNITIKGLIPDTSIWYAVVPDPIKELGSMTISEQISTLNGSRDHR
jgi:predicted O-methyltransferase YrrM